MRILQVVHDFLPHHVAGSELYCFYLSRELARQHEVHILHTEVDYRRPEYACGTRTVDGITCHEVVRHQAARFEDTYADRRMEGIFTRLLDDIRPDVVHIHHLLNHSIEYMALAKARGIGVIVTFHDYWLSCPNYGQRMRADQRLCERIDLAECARCVTTHFGLPRVARRAGPAVMRLMRRGPRDTVVDRPRQSPPGGTLAKMLYRRLEPFLWAGTAASRRRAVARRLEQIRGACESVDLFIAPSEFMAGKMADFGIPRDRLICSPNGMRTDLIRLVRRGPSDAIRIGYVGAVSPHKGVHVLIAAFKALMERPGPRRRAELRIHGNLEWRPDYVARLRAASRGLPVRFHGEFDPADVGTVYAGLDVLVLPSVWWENAPLTFYEAILSGTPVVVSDCGSLPDLLVHRNGSNTFRSGDAADLARRLALFVDDAGALARARPVGMSVKTIARDAADMADRYAQVCLGTADRIVDPPRAKCS